MENTSSKKHWKRRKNGIEDYKKMLSDTAASIATHGQLPRLSWPKVNHAIQIVTSTTPQKNGHKRYKNFLLDVLGKAGHAFFILCAAAFSTGIGVISEQQRQAIIEHLEDYGPSLYSPNLERVAQHHQLLREDIEG
jgi:hypothetical protein